MTDKRSKSLPAVDNKNTCPECELKIPFNVRFCPNCHFDVGFPNVRKANSSYELNALEQRYQKALIQGPRNILENFGRVVDEESTVVICKAFEEVLKLISKPTSVFASFHNEVAIGARMVEDNEWDTIRGSVDALLFPEYQSEINFAALTLDGTGDTYYGGLSMNIDTKAIQKRSSLFHEDSIAFMRRNEISIAGAMPSGYRSSWQNRGKLAVAKLANEITENTTESEFAKILLKKSANDEAGDYIEVHIYGGFTSSAVKSIACGVGLQGAEKTCLTNAIRKAEQNGIGIKLIGD